MLADPAVRSRVVPFGTFCSNVFPYPPGRVDTIRNFDPEAYPCSSLL